MSKPTLADDCERMARILANAPTGGFSLDDIQHQTGITGEKWSLHTCNDVLCAMRPQITSEKVRTRHGKVTRYSLKKGN